MTSFDFLGKQKKFVLGLMSGTSLDGLDIALVQIEGAGPGMRFQLLGFETVPYSQALKSAILDCAVPSQGSTACVSRLNFYLAELWADFVTGFLRKAGYEPREIDLIGSHGQTMAHEPEPVPFGESAVRSTLQIGDPAVLAKKTGIPVVANFRTGDMALGGQGAPLVPYADYLLFRSETQNRAFLNIGGIANVTVLPKQATKAQVFAFDTGPGNMLVDALAQELFRVPFDQDGELAAQGRPSPELLSELMRDPYFDRQPPKSTGREYFGQTFVKRFLNAGPKFNLTRFDLLATALQFTVETIALANDRWIRPKVAIDEWIVSGGGARNPVLRAALQKALAPARLRLSDELGLPADAKEAVAFAILANEFAAGHPANLPSVTGAQSETILGELALP